MSTIAGYELKRLLLNILHLLPLSLEILLPQADFIVSSTHSEDVSARAPTDPPEHSIKFELLAGPLTRIRHIRGPDANSFILGGRRDVGLGKDARRPSNVSDPIGVAFKCLGEIIGLSFRAAYLYSVISMFLIQVVMRNLLCVRTCNPKS